eukprot:5059217-Pyramimonas_sp.AAC.1
MTPFPLCTGIHHGIHQVYELGLAPPPDAEDSGLRAALLEATGAAPSGALRLAAPPARRQVDRALLA